MEQQSIDTVLCDLDGVVWLAHQPIPGSVEAIAALRAHGARVLFVTNNSFATRAQHETALAAIGIDADGDVVSSSMAAASLLEPGARALVAGGPGVAEALVHRGVETVNNDGTELVGSVDAVVVGMHRDFDYRRLAVAADAVRRGARLVGTNADSTYPTPDGLLPGGGAILAAVAVASGVDPVIAGKPHQPMAELVASMLVPSEPPPAPTTNSMTAQLAQRVWMVGDRPETDGEFARRVGCRFALVRSGVTGAGSSPEESASPRPDLDVADLAAVVAELIPRIGRAH